MQSSDDVAAQDHDSGLKKCTISCSVSADNLKFRLLFFWLLLKRFVSLRATKSQTATQESLQKGLENKMWTARFGYTWR